MSFLGGVVEIEDGTSLVFEPTACAPVGRKLKENEEKALQVLKEATPQGLTAGCWKVAAEKKGVLHASFYRTLKALKSYGLVDLIGELYRTSEPSE